MPVINAIKVSLRLSGDDLEPEEVSLALECKPDHSAAKGGLQKTPRGTEVIARTGIWLKHVARRTPGDLDGQIIELLTQMTDDFAVWQRLTTRFRADVFCGLFLKESNEGMSIRPETLLALGRRGLHLDLDIYGTATES